ncbi:MAG: SufE family protein [Hyphomicrobiales bacterium]
MMPTDQTDDINEITENFKMLDDWEDRYRYLIELGSKLTRFGRVERTPENKVHGCVSQVWIAGRLEERDGASVMVFSGDSDAHIVRGLMTILFTACSQRRAEEILKTDIHSIFAKIGLDEHLTPQRGNGLTSMVERIRQDARLVMRRDRAD